MSTVTWIHRPPPEPIGRLVGYLDEYGTIWSGEPGAVGSEAIGDLVPRSDEEVHLVYLLPDTVRPNPKEATCPSSP